MMNVLSLFDGISAGQVALNRANIPYDNYFAAEIEQNAIKITQKNYPKTIQVGSVTELRGSDLPKIDLLLAGSPCQGFSRAGHQLNFNDPRSKLFFEFIRLKEETNPTYFFLENNQMKKEFRDVITNYLGVEPVAANSSLVSAQNRARLYWTNIPNATPPKDKKINLRAIVGEYDGIWVYPRGFNKGGLQHYKGKSPTITTSSWQHNFFIVQNGVKRKFTVEECEQLQTLPINYTEGVSENQRYKLIGNSWTVDMISHFFSNL